MPDIGYNGYEYKWIRVQQYRWFEVLEKSTSYYVDFRNMCGNPATDVLVLDLLWCEDQRDAVSFSGSWSLPVVVFFARTTVVL
jgi:hypothetical protein